MTIEAQTFNGLGRKKKRNDKNIPFSIARIVISILYKGYPESKGHRVTAKKKKKNVQAILMAPCH